MVRLFVLASVCSVAMLALGSAPALADPPCGATLTQSVTLTADLDCSGYTAGLVFTIAKKKITLDLGGHTITGGGSSGTIGVLNGSLQTVKGGFAGFTVQNGTFKD